MKRGKARHNAERGMNMIAAKFGGTSLADADAFRRVAAIVQDQPERRYIVPSAPGKREQNDIKVTDLLLACHRAATAGCRFEGAWNQLRTRFLAIADSLGLSLDVEGALTEIKERMPAESADWAASRGEMLCGRMLADYLQFAFIDPVDTIRFSAEGQFLPMETGALLRRKLSGVRRAVVPGFYGGDELGKTHVFSRGGSDITGALVAQAVNADVYENWTDVCGVRMADPRVIPDARFIDAMTYRELKEMARMGASVLHEDALSPVREAGIPLNIRNTFEPTHPGTLITCTPAQEHPGQAVTGIAGGKGYALVAIEKNGLTPALAQTALDALAPGALLFEARPAGGDVVTAAIRVSGGAPLCEKALTRLRRSMRPDRVTVQEGIALLSVIGRSAAFSAGIAARVLTVLSAQGVAVRLAHLNPAAFGLLLGVDEGDYAAAVRILYDAFIRE